MLTFPIVFSLVCLTLVPTQDALLRLEYPVYRFKSNGVLDSRLERSVRINIPDHISAAVDPLLFDKKDRHFLTLTKAVEEAKIRAKDILHPKNGGDLSFEKRVAEWSKEIASLNSKFERLVSGKDQSLIRYHIEANSLFSEGLEAYCQGREWIVSPELSSSLKPAIVLKELREIESLAVATLIKDLSPRKRIEFERLFDEAQEERVPAISRLWKSLNSLESKGRDAIESDPDKSRVPVYSLSLARLKETSYFPDMPVAELNIRILLLMRASPSKEAEAEMLSASRKITNERSAIDRWWAGERVKVNELDLSQQEKNIRREDLAGQVSVKISDLYDKSMRGFSETTKMKIQAQKLLTDYQRFGLQKSLFDRQLVNDAFDFQISKADVDSMLSNAGAARQVLGDSVYKYIQEKLVVELRKTNSEKIGGSFEWTESKLKGTVPPIELMVFWF